MTLFDFCELKTTMRIPRIYLDQEITSGHEAPLDERSAHYLANVLRMKKGSELILFNGSGMEYSATVLTLDRKKGAVLVNSQTDPGSESALFTHLGIGLSRGERMDYVVQKSTELGVNVIQPLFTEFCEVKLDSKRAAKKREHWTQVSISACEQSGRVKLPEIREPIPLKRWLESTLDCQKKYLLDQAQASELDAAYRPESVALLIGPEGGLSENEKALASGQGFTRLKLGSRTLRTETAPVAALSLFQHLWGN